jgi:diaminohydroxyphosphoribosylaminopyrimidine deaminase/5-amino-6-(5-phosphoribosylamino)uracil reductase
VTPADDVRLTRLAIAVGRRNLGLTWPNPSVGAVLVQEVDGEPRILAQGVTRPGGRPHAEPVALEAAGDAARGGTLYVSLEPCSHHGRTPPCTDAIVAARVSRVVTGTDDPDPRVAGRGHALLRETGMAVTAGLLSAEAAAAHIGHITRVRSGRPAVMAKLARTADGFAAALSGNRLLITGDAANARTHMLRAHTDAVAVGIGTVLADDPRLDVRLPGLETRRPVRIVFDSRLRLPATSYLARTAAAQSVWVLCADGAPAEAERRLADLGIVVIRAARSEDGRVDLAAALGTLGSRGLTRILFEAGPGLADALAAADLIDELLLMTGHGVLASPGLPALGPVLARALGTRFLRTGRELVGSDILESFERTLPCSPAS